MEAIETKKKILSCAFTGPRFNGKPTESSEQHPFTLTPRAKQTLKRIIQTQYQKGLRRFYCGCAFGADLEAGELVLNMKQEYPDMELYCVLPYANQAARWSPELQDRYHALLDQADQVIVLRERFVRGCYHARNRYMVDHADLVIAVGYLQEIPSPVPQPTPKTSGTEYTVQYALRHQIPVIALDGTTRDYTLLT